MSNCAQNIKLGYFQHNNSIMRQRVGSMLDASLRLIHIWSTSVFLLTLPLWL